MEQSIKDPISEVRKILKYKRCAMNQLPIYCENSYIANFMTQENKQ